jgi:EAL domain-containing protein (putative c-di-GMP-specific phosphodiesterase class I)/GGDEF domain-containing protein
VGAVIMEKKIQTKSKLVIEELAFRNKVTGERNLNFLDILLSETDKTELIGKYLYAAFDVKNFRYVNNAMGYEGGNQVLRIICDCINEEISEEELLIHAEGDYFSMLLHYDEQEKAIPRIASMFTDVESRVHRTYDNSLNLVFACGVYFIHHDKIDVRYLSDRVNLARNSRKNLFNTQIVVYNSDMEKQILEKKSIEGEMENALLREEFVVYLQPKINILTNKVYAAEALVRWFNADDMMMPGVFIPLFEENGFIVKMDLFMFREICKLKQRWNQDDVLKDLSISVNISRVHFYYSDFVPRLVEICDECGISPEEIEIELTESAFLDNYGMMIEQVKAIKGAGFSLSIDDFGTGYSSLNLLKAIPADVIKIDRQFIIDDDAKSQTIIKHIISMIRDIKMQVITEGVETSKQIDFLLDSGCENVQGFYYSRPLPVAEFERFAYQHIREIEEMGV